MLSIVYCYVSIQHHLPIEEEKELRDLLFDMKTLYRYDHYISDIIIDDVNKRIIVDVNIDGYNYLLENLPSSCEATIRKVIYHTYISKQQP